MWLLPFGKGQGFGPSKAVHWCPQVQGGCFDERSRKGSAYWCRSDQKVLLLLRNSKHNDSTWGLPGGNAEAGDANLLQTATREAVEEMGALPGFEVIAEIATR